MAHCSLQVYVSRRAATADIPRYEGERIEGNLPNANARRDSVLDRNLYLLAGALFDYQEGEHC